MKIKERFEKSISWKLTGLFTAILIVVAVFYSVYFPIKQKDLSLTAAKSKVALVAEMLSFSVGAGFADDNFALVTKAFNWAKKDPNFNYIGILDESNSVFVDYNPKNLPINAANLAQQPGLRANSESVTIVTPIQYNDKNYGSIVLNYSLVKVNQEISSSRTVAFFLTIVILLAAIGLVVFFLKKITQDILKVRDAAREVGEGDLSHYVEVSSRDEVGDLAAAINRMIDSLRSKEEENRKTMEMVDGIVAEIRRTAELQKAGDLEARGGG